MNDDRPATAAYDRPCPLAFVVLAVFASVLVWMCAVLVYMPVR
jgi:hypothetical protein